MIAAGYLWLDEMETEWVGGEALQVFGRRFQPVWGEMRRATSETVLIWLEMVQ